jgi:XTP/dITP diphosphohydrolase
MARTVARASRIVLASHNRGKLAEIAPMLAPWDMQVVSAGELGLPEPEETAPDFVGNARLKALAAATATGLVSLADDSGFCVAALGGAPGVVSARWAGPTKDFAAAMDRLHREIGENPDRRAWFVCVLSLAWPDGRSESFYGRVDGRMVWPPRGAQGFGYDPIFVPAGETATFGEMEAERKYALSHRTRAFRQLTATCLSIQPW